VATLPPLLGSTVGSAPDTSLGGRDTPGHRGRVGDPLYGIRRVLRRGADTLTDRAWDRLLAGLDTGDAGGQVAAAWIAAQYLRLLYRAPTVPAPRNCTTASSCTAPTHMSPS